jgi:hypothetical protein
MSLDSRGVGRTIVDAELSPEASPEEAVAAANRIFVALGARLGRWVGGDAFDALFQRALAKSRRDHPVLEHVRWGDAGRSGFECAGEGVTTEAVQDATAATLDALAALLGRFVGDDLAARLLQDCHPSASDVEPERKP